MTLEHGLDRSCEECKCYNNKKCKTYVEEWSRTFHQNDFDDMIIKMKEMKSELAKTCKYYNK